MNTIYGLLFMVLLELCQCNDPACDTTKQINDWKRSVAYAPLPNDTHICDSFLQKGWYRVTSQAGQKMPRKCPRFGYSCCTDYSIWLSNRNVPRGEKLYPKVHQTVDRIACMSMPSGDCCKEQLPIQIKNCGSYFVYYLTPPTICPSAYCFGDKIPCPAGQSSDTGFPPVCGTYPKVTVKPTVETSLNIQHGLGGFKNQFNYTFERVQFKCVVGTLLPKYTCNVRWYINDFIINTATKKDVQANKLGDALLHQLEWDTKFKPPMRVKCSLQIRETGYTAPGPEQFSDDFFAGVRVKQTVFSVEEGSSVSIPIELTIPLGCSYPSRLPRTRIDQIKEKTCVLNLLFGVPKYQTDGDDCQFGLNKKSLSFESQKCGIYFSNLKWKDKQMVHITGNIDNVVNLDDRITAIRLYSDAKKVTTAMPELDLWKGILLPDTKITVVDKDNKLLGKACSSNNDPHISTFEGQYFSFHNKEGEYILYRNKNIPVQVHAYYRKCNNGALCNCGAAIRSGESAFIVNFCNVKGHQNHYVTQKICKDHEMQVTANGNAYTVTTMSGTQVTIKLGQVFHFFGINSFVVKASALDQFNSEGLCGTLNGDRLDDLMPQNGNTPYTMRAKWGIIEPLGKSWRVTKQGDSLFNIYTIKAPVYHPKQYCTCEKPATDYPYGEPNVNCKLKSSLHLCRQLVIPRSIYHAPCKHVNFKTKRKRSIDTGREAEMIKQEDDDAPEMFLMDVDDGEESNVDTSWKNGWNDKKARDFCTKHFQTSKSFEVCRDHVPSVPSEKFINECVEDIKIAGDTSWLDVSLDNFGSACFHEAEKIENLTKANATDGNGASVNIFTIIAEATCPKNCSGQGRCENGMCNCTEGYFGSACERQQHEAPELLTTGFDGLCDTSSKPCKKYVIPGLHFMEGKLTCKYRHFKIELNETYESGIVEYVDGEYSSMFSMKCPAPSSRHRRSASIKQSALGYFISVSNDGHNFTEELTVIIYDSICFECNTSSLSCEEVPSCPQQTPVKPEESHTAEYVGAGLGGATAVIIIVVVLIYVKKKLLKGRTAVKDSTVSLQYNADIVKETKTSAFGTVDQK